MKANKSSEDMKYNITGKTLKKMLFAALNTLKKNKKHINSLNVFPVPDGDTGTNMYLTFLGGIEKVKKTDSEDVSRVTTAMAQGALMEARGNSGVILSQLLRGFSVINKGSKTMDAEKYTKSLRKASEIAYQGVMKPVEGTILTVSKGAARGAEKALEKNLSFKKVVQSSVENAQKSLDNTPEQLKALKEAGVVDAGGQGYVTILKGFLNYLMGEVDINENKILEKDTDTDNQPEKIETELEFIYDTQFLVNLEQDFNNIDINDIRNDLREYGDSLIVVGSENTLKVHIHSNNPGLVLEFAQKFGDLQNVDIENMKLQSRKQEEHVDDNLKNELNKDINNDLYIVNNSSENEGSTEVNNNEPGFVSVASGSGIKNIFNDLGVHQIINGGQSMNPSTNDFLEAVNKINKNNIVVFPNNGNVISAAKQASSISEKNVNVIPTESFPEAVASLILKDSYQEFDKLVEGMKKEIKEVKTFKITEAVKNSTIDNMTIDKGDIIGLFQNEIKVKSSSYQSTISKLFTNYYDDEELITIYYGNEVKKEVLDELIDYLEDKYEFIEIESYFGGQTLYPFIISLE